MQFLYLISFQIELKLWYGLHSYTLTGLVIMFKKDTVPNTLVKDLPSHRKIHE